MLYNTPPRYMHPLAAACQDGTRRLCLRIPLPSSLACGRLRETKTVYGRLLHYRPLRCSDVPLYDSVVDSHAHGLLFPPTLVVAGALMLKRWIVQYGSSEQT
jgi:hypothetical protein